MNNELLARLNAPLSYQEKPLQPDKGLWMGSCNRRACQYPGANWWNRSTRAYYCSQCARDINRVNCREAGEELLCSQGKHES